MTENAEPDVLKTAGHIGAIWLPSRFRVILNLTTFFSHLLTANLNLYHVVSFPANGSFCFPKHKGNFTKMVVSFVESTNHVG
jgi:hypothetical protein